MASCTTTRLLLLVLLSSAAVLAATSTTSTATATAAVPRYCAAGQAIPASPLPSCVWYVATRSCDDVVAAMLPIPLPELRHACCQELGAVPPECRCRALRVMMRTPLVVGSRPADQQRCRAAQARFAPDVVDKAECGLVTVHGTDFCNGLDDE